MKCVTTQHQEELKKVLQTASNSIKVQASIAAKNLEHTITPHTTPLVCTKSEDIVQLISNQLPNCRFNNITMISQILNNLIIKFKEFNINDPEAQAAQFLCNCLRDASSIVKIDNSIKSGASRNTLQKQRKELSKQLDDFLLKYHQHCHQECVTTNIQKITDTNCYTEFTIHLTAFNTTFTSIQLPSFLQKIVNVFKYYFFNNKAKRQYHEDLYNKHLYNLNKLINCRLYIQDVLNRTEDEELKKLIIKTDKQTQKKIHAIVTRLPILKHKGGDHQKKGILSTIYTQLQEPLSDFKMTKPETEPLFTKITPITKVKQLISLNRSQLDKLLFKDADDITSDDFLQIIEYVKQCGCKELTTPKQNKPLLLQILQSKLSLEQKLKLYSTASEAYLENNMSDYQQNLSQINTYILYYLDLKKETVFDMQEFIILCKAFNTHINNEEVLDKMAKLVVDKMGRATSYSIAEIIQLQYALPTALKNRIKDNNNTPRR